MSHTKSTKGFIAYLSPRERQIPFHGERGVDEHEEHGNFDERPDHRCERIAGIDAEDRDADDNREFEIIACGRQRERRRFSVTRTDALSHHERDEKHDPELNNERDIATAGTSSGCASDPRALQCEHGDERERCDCRDEMGEFPRLPAPARCPTRFIPSFSRGNLDEPVFQVWESRLQTWLASGACSAAL